MYVIADVVAIDWRELSQTVGHSEPCLRRDQWQMLHSLQSVLKSLLRDILNSHFHLGHCSTNIANRMPISLIVPSREIQCIGPRCHLSRSSAYAALFATHEANRLNCRPSTDADRPSARPLCQTLLQLNRTMASLNVFPQPYPAGRCEVPECGLRRWATQSPPHISCSWLALASSISQ